MDDDGQADRQPSQVLPMKEGVLRMNRPPITEGLQVILDYRARRGLVCAVAGGCVTTLENTSNNITADELAVVGIKGASGARATVTHCAGVCTPP